jgi:hypothetical protein
VILQKKPIRKKIESAPRMIEQQNNPVIEKTFELKIKTLQNVPEI